MTSILRIANAQGFWGDDPDAPARLATQSSNLDYLTLDYLAEVSMSILAKQRQRNPNLGYARDFLDVVRSLIPIWQSGRKLKLIANAGGLNPRACAQAAAAILKDAGLTGMKLGIVTGDDVLQLLQSTSAAPSIQNPKSKIQNLLTANAYLGAAPVVEAIRRGADIVVTGRVADPSLTVAPAIAHFNWLDDYDRIAGATIGGHLIECGTQVTGGISTNWLGLPDPGNIGFPIAEVAADGSCVITKPPNTGGRVNEQTVKEQLLYEIGDPSNYLSPDATVSFLSLHVEDLGNDRVRVYGASGKPPPPTYKVSATYAAGYHASGTLAIFGRDAAAKARRGGDIVLQRLRAAGREPQRYLAECIGAGEMVPTSQPRTSNPVEVVLRLSAADDRRDVVEYFTRQIVPLVTSGPPGTTGYAEGRPRVHESIGYWPTLIPRDLVTPNVEILEI